MPRVRLVRLFLCLEAARDFETVLSVEHGEALAELRNEDRIGKEVVTVRVVLLSLKAVQRRHMIRIQVPLDLARVAAPKEQVRRVVQRANQIAGGDQTDTITRRHFQHQRRRRRNRGRA